MRLLQPADFGLVSLATGFIASVDALSAIGVQDALVRAPVLNRALYDTGFGLSVLRGMLTALLVALIAWPVAGFFSDPRLSVVMLALSLGTVVSAFENIGIIDFRRDLAFRKEFNMQLWSRLAGATTTIAVAGIWHTYWALVAGILVYRLVRLSQSYVISSYRPRLAIRAWREIIGFSLWTWAQTILYQVRERSDSIIIGRVLDTAQVGVFSVGTELGSLPTTELVEPLGRALFSGFASLHNASAGLANMFVGAIELGLLVVLPAGVGISVIADPMVRLCLGQNWLAAVPVVQIMAVGGVTAIITQSCGNLLNAVGRPHVMFYAGMASTAVKIIASLVLLHYLGLAGAALAMVISNSVDLILLLRSTLFRIGVQPRRLAACIVRPAIGTIVMVVVLWQLGMAWTPSNGSQTTDLLQDAVVRSAIGAACYCAAVLGAWLWAGKPDGAERYVLRVAGDSWRRVRRNA